MCFRNICTDAVCAATSSWASTWNPPCVCRCCRALVPLGNKETCTSASSSKPCSDWSDLIFLNAKSVLFLFSFFQRTKAFYPAERRVTSEHAVRVRLDFFFFLKRTWRENLLRRITSRTYHTSVHQCSTDSARNAFAITRSRRDMWCDVFSIP